MHAYPEHDDETVRVGEGEDDEGEPRGGAAVEDGGAHGGEGGARPLAARLAAGGDVEGVGDVDGVVDAEADDEDNAHARDRVDRHAPEEEHPAEQHKNKDQGYPVWFITDTP